MGALHGQKCYPDAIAARDSYFSDIAPTIVSTNTISYQFDGVASQWLRVVTAADGTSTSTVAPVPNFQTCDPSQGFTDGVSLGLLVSGALVMASMWGIISRAK